MRPESTPDSRAPQESEQDQIAEAQKSIGERVQFWEEQDKINQELSSLASSVRRSVSTSTSRITKTS